MPLGWHSYPASANKPNRTHARGSVQDPNRAPLAGQRWTDALPGIDRGVGGLGDGLGDGRGRLVHALQRGWGTQWPQPGECDRFARRSTRESLHWAAGDL